MYMPPWRFCNLELVACFVFATVAHAEPVRCVSPNERNVIVLDVADDGAVYSVLVDDHVLFSPAPCGPSVQRVDLTDDRSKVVDVQRGTIDQTFELLWGKAKQVTDRCSFVLLTIENATGVRWQVELRAYDDGVAFRYRLVRQERLVEFAIEDERTQFQTTGAPVALFNTLDGFMTSHESVYERKKFSDISANRLIDCPFLLEWPDGRSAAITEARVRDFAGLYLERETKQSTSLQCRLSPLQSAGRLAVKGETPHASPWRVILLADSAGTLLESNLLLCLNEPSNDDFRWARPGKTTFHWWNGDFDIDHEQANEREVFLARHRKYIDFCAENDIAYHSVSGDGFAWYKQSRVDYETAAADADVRVARPELGLPEIFDYAKSRGVGIRLWVHWKALNMHLEEAMQIYEGWGVKGLMVDFLDRDDQVMLDFVDRMLTVAARHKIHIQIHGSSKYSGEQRTFPHLFNREGVLNLEYNKWSKLCTPAHNVNVAFTRSLAGPVDYHSGGFRSATREQFEPRPFKPMVMGTRCHNVALFVIYENPMPMVADSPEAYQGQAGFDFVKEVPTTWDETRFLQGKAGEFIVLARRKADRWYLGGITNWTEREIKIPLKFLGEGDFELRSWTDGEVADTRPNEVAYDTQMVTANTFLHVAMKIGGGFVAVASPRKK